MTEKLEYKEFTIKKKNGKKRRICAPSKELLKYQRSILPWLTSFFIQTESKYFDMPVFHGFVKNRNCVTAALQHKGFEHTIMLDISNFFDSVHYEDLTAKYDLSTIDAARVTHKDGTLAQGFATSPILANLYLVDAIRQLDSYLKDTVHDYALTVYADDIQISLAKTTFEKLDEITQVVTSILAESKLVINKSKTRVRHSKYGNRKILGIQVGADTLTPTRKLKKKIRAARHQGNHCSLGGLVTVSKMLLPKAIREY